MWTLQVMVGNHESSRCDLAVGAEVVIGRDPTVDIVVNERSVSRRHCRLVGTPLGIDVLDLHSANGIWVDGKQVTNARIGSGGEVQVGTARIRVGRKDGPTGMVPQFAVSESSTAARTISSSGTSSSSGGDSSSPALKLDASHTAYKSLEKERLALLIEAGKSLGGALEVNDVLERIMDHMFQILQVRRCVIALLQPDGSLRLQTVRPASTATEISDYCSQHIIQRIIERQKGEIIDDASLDDYFNRAQSILAMNIKAAICAPLTAQNRVLGALYADFPGRAKLYSQTDLDFLSAFASLAAVALENARLQSDARERMKMQRDLEIAGEIQLGLLPEDTFPHPGIVIDWAYRPSRHVGGDFYDCAPLAGGRLAMMLGDVSGKGVPAALFMARIMSFFRAFATDEASPATLLTRCNLLLGTRVDRVMFATCCILAVDPEARTVRWASAGHNPVLIYDAVTDAFKDLGASEPPIGINEDLVYTDREESLAPGAMIVMYTDGLVEARSRAGEFYGLDAVKNVVRRHAQGTPQDVTGALITAVEAHWLDSDYIRDDFALLVARLQPGT